MAEKKDFLKAFIREILVYRDSLKSALEKILGREESKKVFFYLETLETKGSYIRDPEVAKRLGAFFVGREEDLGLYVLCSYDSSLRVRINEDGKINPTGVALSCRPFFLYWPKAILHKAAETDGFLLPKYLMPWVHEFGHFLCYCLQEYPIMVAMSLSAGFLRQSGHPVRHIEDLSTSPSGEDNPLIWETERWLVQWSALNEAMAIWWEDNLLKAMEFDAAGYVEAKKKGNPYMTQLEGCSSITAIEYMRRWHSPSYYPEDFTRNFVSSFSTMMIDKWSFLESSAAIPVEEER